MAATRKKKAPGRRAADTGEELEGELPADIAGVLEELGTEGTTIQLHRRANDALGAAERYGYVTTYAAEDIAPGSFMERVKSEWGGGRYQARIYTANRKQPVRMRNFTIDSAFDRPDPRAPVPDGTTQAMADMLRELRRDLEELRRGASAPPAAAGDSLKTAMEIAGMIQSQNATTMQLLVEMAKGGGARGTPTAEILGGVREVLALSRELSGTGEAGAGGGEPSFMSNIMEHLGKPLLERLGQLADAERAKTNVPAPRRLEAGAPPPAPEVTTVNVPPDFPAWVHAVAPWMPQLQELARAGSDAELWADVVVDRSDEPTLAVIAEALALPQAAMAAQFYGAFPGARSYREWFEALFGRLRAALLEAEPYPPADSATPCGIQGCQLEVGHDGEHDAGDAVPPEPGTA